MKKTFYYDYFSLENVDIRKWHEAFFWPVPRETTTQITLDFKGEQCRIINEIGYTFEGDCFLIGHLLSYKYIQVVNHYIAVHRLLETGYSIQYSNKLKLIPLLLSKNADIEFEHENIWDIRKEKKSVRFIKQFIRSYLYNFKKGTHFFPYHFIADRSVYGFHNDNVINRTYTKSLRKWIHFTSPEEWLDPCLAESVSPCSKKIFFDIASTFVSFAQKYTQDRFGISLPENIANALSIYTVSYLFHISHVFSALRKKTRQIRTKNLLTPTAGNTFVRALSLAVRERGGIVTGFPHGYYICHYSSPRQALHELATVDYFMTYTPGSVPLIERNLAINPPPRNNAVKILHENTSLFINSWRNWRNNPSTDRIKTVMVLELSLLPEWAGYHAAESMMNYHFYYHLCQTLSRKGYSVIFKRRPKAPDWNGINLFREIPNVDIVYEPFEKKGVIEQADAVFIQYAMSSTLYWAMCTNKTVIYIDAGWEPWFPDVYELMSKRCGILHCWYDERNRQCFDEKELMTLLKTISPHPNTEFLEKYLFPEE